MFIIIYIAEELKLLEDDDYTEEGYGLIAVRKAFMMDPAKVTQAEQEMLYHPSTAASKNKKNFN